MILFGTLFPASPLCIHWIYAMFNQITLTNRKIGTLRYLQDLELKGHLRYQTIFCYKVAFDV